VLKCADPDGGSRNIFDGGEQEEFIGIQGDYLKI
jgi:hypothetical protein